MTITLATTWNPRGELPRFERLLPQLEQQYLGIVISFPPVADPQVTQLFTLGNYAGRADLLAFVNQEWSAGRYMALRKALQFSADYIQYADMDRLLRWVEVYPQDWQRAVLAIQQTDCLIMGRTEAAYATHPKNLVQTEAISNQVVSHCLGRTMDVSAGTKGFSRRAVEFLMANTLPGKALGTDAEWPILLQRGGFRVDYMALDSLDWETADRYRSEAASAADQRTTAEKSDADPASWAWRVQVAQEIIEAAFEAAERPLQKEGER
jgi:hypothetical protein